MMDLWSETTLGRAKYSFCAIKPVVWDSHWLVFVWWLRS